MPLDRTQSLQSETSGEVDIAVLELLGEFQPLVRHASAGEQLDRSLAMDQKLREARTRVMQRRIYEAYRIENHARSVCVGAGLGSILLWVAVLTPALPIGRGMDPGLASSLGVLAMLLGLLVGVSLPVSAVLAVAASRWRRHLLRAAVHQHLMVRDPAKIDIP